MANEPLATIVVTPRERYSRALRCFGTVVDNTQTPHRLVYVSGGDPPPILQVLQHGCRERGYELIAAQRFLGSNEARNIGLARVTTKYVVFIENDVIVEPGWLEALLRCAEETGADVVGPLILYGEPAEGRCHSIGGDLSYRDEGGCLTIEENHRLPLVDLRVKRVPLRRSRCDFVEFHCLLARRDLFDEIGRLDEAVICAAENVDLCLLVRQRGGHVYSEPAAIVSVIGADGHLLYDTDFFDVRWGDEWFEATLARFQSKWRMAPDASFLRDYRSHYGRYRENCRLPRRGVCPAGPITAERYPFARAIDALVEQMSAAYTAGEIDAVKEAYTRSLSLYHGVVRETGRMHIAHALGTASVLAAYGMPRAVIIAGLHHASYALGRYPAHVGDDLASARRWLHRQIGGGAEAQVWDYYTLSFEAAHAAAVDGDIEAMPLTLAYTVLMRIANSIDEHLDNGLIHTRDPAGTLTRNRLQNERWAAIYARVAGRLRCTPMLDALLALHDEVSARWPGAVPPSPFAETASPPQTHRWQRGLDAPRPPSLPRDDRPYSERLRPRPGPLLRSYGLADLLTWEGATVTRQSRPLWGLLRKRQARVQTAPEQWSYACGLAIDPDDALDGAVDVRVELAVSVGRFGVGVLWRGSTTEFVVPEVSVEPSSEPLEIVFRLPEVREAGYLIFRNWAKGASTARILSVSLHAPAPPAGLVP